MPGTGPGHETPTHYNEERRWRVFLLPTETGFITGRVGEVDIPRLISEWNLNTHKAIVESVPPMHHDSMTVILDTPAANLARLLTDTPARETGWMILDLNTDIPVMRKASETFITKNHRDRALSKQVSSVIEDAPPRPPLYRSSSKSDCRRLICSSHKPGGLIAIIIALTFAASLFGGFMYFIVGNIWPSLYFLTLMVVIAGFRFRVLLMRDVICGSFKLIGVLPFGRTKRAEWQDVNAINNLPEGAAIETGNTTLWIRTRHADHRQWILSEIKLYLNGLQT